MREWINGYLIEERNREYEISCGDGYVLQKELTKELAALWTYSELYRVLKEDCNRRKENE